MEEENNIITFINSMNPEAAVVDGFDDCIIGIGETFGRDPVLVYSKEKIIAKLMDEDDMTYEDALEYFDFNIIGASINDHMPIFMWNEWM